MLVPAVLFGLLFSCMHGDSQSNNGWNSINKDLKDVKRILLKFGPETVEGAIPNKMVNSFSQIRSRALKSKTKPRVQKPVEQNGLGFESDLVLTPEEKQAMEEMERKGRVRRKAVANEMKLWPGGIVYYQMSNGLDGDAIRNVTSAMKTWEDHTCLRFREHSAVSSSPDRVIFVGLHQCQSPIGRRGGPQEVMVGGCKDVDTNQYETISIAHEIAHSFGFYHEHTRPDRDDHVTIYSNNIERGFEMDFKKIGVRSIHDIEPYDVSSVMHYGPTYMSKGPQLKTIVPRMRNLIGVMGQRTELSFLDIKTANDLYKCSKGCSIQLGCKNKGYVGPNCACLCPKGLTGRDCTEVVRSNTNCGGRLTDTSGNFTSPNYPGDYTPNSECLWVIMGPPGSTITLTIEDFIVEWDNDTKDCYDWLEVNLQGPHMGGARFCGVNQDDENMPPPTIEYPDSTLLIRLHTDYSNEFRGFRARYTIHI